VKLSYSRFFAPVIIGLTLTVPPSLGAELTIPVFPFPGLGAFLPPIIDAKGFGRANDLDITWKTEPERVYRTNFAAGTNKIGGSATLLADVAKLNELGVETVFLFNIFDFWGTVVVAADSGISKLGDLQGSKLAASLPTTNYALFRYAAKMDGIDLSEVEIQASPVLGLIPIMLAGRVDGVQVWEPAHSQLVYGNDNFRALDVVGVIARHTGQSKIPYVGIAAHKSWVEDNGDLIPKLFATYAAAAAFINDNPEEAAEIISEASDGNLTQDVLVDLIRSGRMGMDVYWVSDVLSAAKATFEAAMSIEYLNQMPADSIVYGGEGLR
jgi:ABC-type nitrate/sulfonate/bicarbonate transport system substrate-binding protein